MRNPGFKTIISFLLVFGLILPSFGFAQAPETLDEAKSFGLNVLEQLPDAVKEVWKNQALPIWQGMWNWAKPQIEPWRQKFLGLLGQEIEKRKPDIKKEFQKEKEEIKKELPRVGESIWQRFKALLD